MPCERCEQDFDPMPTDGYAATASTRKLLHGLPTPGEGIMMST
jgi:hypothetical protein